MRQAAAAAVKGDRTVAELASEFESGDSADKAHRANDTQVNELRRQIDQLKVENDFLAKRLGR